MKKYKIIGLSVLLTIFIVSNFVISFSLTKGMDSNINVSVNQASADPESYGNDQDGYCLGCSQWVPSLGTYIRGVEIYCYGSLNHLCYASGCSDGFCD